MKFSEMKIESVDQWIDHTQLWHSKTMQQRVYVRICEYCCKYACMAFVKSMHDALEVKKNSKQNIKSKQIWNC